MSDARMTIGQSIECSPAQYRWAFDDLRSMTDADAGRHYAEYGRREISTFARHTPADRLLKISLQRLSSQPDATPSEFFHAVPGHGTLDVFFSHGNVPMGRFGWLGVAEGPSGKLFVNTRGNDWYRFGVPGVTASLSETTHWISRVASSLLVDKVRLFGSSMGAPAAIAVGAELGADEVFAFDSELKVGRAIYRSIKWSTMRHYPAELRNLLPSSAALGRRLHLFQSAWDPLEARWIATSITHDLRPTLVHAFHGDIPSLVDWPTFFAGNATVLEALTARSIVREPLGIEVFRRLHRSYVHGVRGRLAKARRSLDEINSTARLDGLLYFRSLLLRAIGDTEAADRAMTAWQERRAALGYAVNTPPAEDTAREYFAVTA